MCNATNQYPSCGEATLHGVVDGSIHGMACVPGLNVRTNVPEIIPDAVNAALEPTKPCHCPEGKLSAVRGEILCAKLCHVRKEGPNKGRPFYQCFGGCGFFEWADGNPNSLAIDSSAITLVCPCGGQALVHVTKKAGPNQGRRFNKCNACKRFNWMEPESTSSQMSSSLEATASGVTDKDFSPPPPVTATWHKDVSRTTSACATLFRGAAFVLGSSFDHSTHDALTKSIIGAGGRIHVNISSDATAYFVVPKDESISQLDRQAGLTACNLGVFVVTDDFVAHSLESGFQQARALRARASSRMRTVRALAPSCMHPATAGLRLCGKISDPAQRLR